MNKFRVAFALLLILLLTTSVVGADPPAPPQPGRAMFLDWPDCYIFDVEWTWYHIPDCNPTISLITNSRTGMLHWTAKAQLPEGAVLPEKGAYKVTYEDSGFACWWDVGVETTNYSITITPNGHFNIACHFRPDKFQP
jgi:hypothetical protein